MISGQVWAIIGKSGNVVNICGCLMTFISEEAAMQTLYILKRDEPEKSFYVRQGELSYNVR